MVAHPPVADVCGDRRLVGPEEVAQRRRRSAELDQPDPDPAVDGLGDVVIDELVGLHHDPQRQDRGEKDDEPTNEETLEI